MSFSSERPKRLALAAAVVAATLAGARPAAALNVHAVYRAACDRALGIVVRVDKRSVQLVGLDGTLATIPRHEIVSLAYYPVSDLPLDVSQLERAVPPLVVAALVGDRVVSLVEGWPVDYSEEKIAFLQRDGRELVVDRESIWSLRFVPPPRGPAAQRPPSPAALVFMHPQASGFCEEALPNETGVRRVFPQQFLNEEIVIKRELDRLQQGHQQVLEYEGDQKFYPVPQLYRNTTTLGLWAPLGSRHGRSSHRSPWAPLLVDELSLGPFRYQHVFMSGSAPARFFPHEETQTYVYYRFKAAYFHASILLDPALLLVGEKYRWRRSDFDGDAADDRTNDSFAAELGFDFGPLALQLFPIVASHTGIATSDGFAVRTSNFFRAGPRLTFRRLEVELLGGLGTGDQPLEQRLVRFNVDAAIHRRVRLGYSGIVRTVRLDGRTEQETDGPRFYESTTVTNSLRGAVSLGRRFTLEAYAGLEWKRSIEEPQPGARRAARALHPKLGVGSSFAF